PDEVRSQRQASPVRRRGQHRPFTGRQLQLETVLAPLFPPRAIPHSDTGRGARHWSPDLSRPSRRRTVPAYVWTELGPDIHTYLWISSLPALLQASCLRKHRG